MNEEKFWEIISLIDFHPETFYNIYDYQECQADLVKQELIDLPFKEVIEFDKIYNEKLYDLFQPKVVEIYMIGCLPFEKLRDEEVYVSNDGFRDFRGWIISQGKRDFEVVKNFGSEAEVLHLNFDINYANNSSLEFILNQLYEEDYAQPYDEEVERLYKDHTDEHYFADFSDIVQTIDWQNLDKKYPKMFEKYKHKNESK